MSLKAIDLFAGCGGLSKGFENAGFEVAAAFEFWDVAANCYEKNFKHSVYRMDLSEVRDAVKIIKKYEPSIIIGGPPCQDFSHAGKRIEAGRATLTEAFAEIVQHVKPKYFVMENVDRAINSKAFSCARSIFMETGYGLTEIVLDSSRCGIPQKRKRFFCIGALNKPDNFAKNSLLAHVSRHETTLRDYFGDTLGFDFYYRHPRNYNRRAIFSIDEPAPTMRGVNRPIPKGYPGHPNDACKLRENIRSLTTLERALIQTFPPDFKWCGNKTEMEQMIGNAVPVKLAEFVGKALLNVIFINENSEKNLIDGDFKPWLLSQCKYSERTARDTISRIKRADKLCRINDSLDSFYLYKLQQMPAFNDLSGSVRSQIKRAVTLYCKFLNEKGR